MWSAWSKWPRPGSSPGAPDLPPGKSAAARRALELLERARSYPPNLGEGKSHGAQENQLLYWLGVAHDTLGERAAAKRCWKDAATGMKVPSPAVYYNDQNPDTIFYQGLALRKLGRRAAAKQRFEALVKFALAAPARPHHH